MWELLYSLDHFNIKPIMGWINIQLKLIYQAKTEVLKSNLKLKSKAILPNTSIMHT